MLKSKTLLGIICFKMAFNYHCDECDCTEIVSAW